MAEETPNAKQMEQESEEIVETQVSEQTDPVEPESPETEEVAEEAPPEELDDSNIVKSKRGQKRVQDLANKAKEADVLTQENESLKDKLESRPTDKDSSTREFLEQLQGDGIPYTGDYVKDLQLAENRAAQKALNQFQKVQSKREKFRDDTRYVEDTYSELRTGAEQFDSDLTNDIVTLYKDSSKLNPALELKPFVDKIMNLRSRAVSEGRSSSVEELSKQQNEGAVIPSAGVKKEHKKDPKDMSFQEIEELVGYA